MSELALDHSALMDKVYRRQRHIYDFTRAWYLLGRDHMLAGLNPKDGAGILEIGCGTGRNLVAAARRFPRAYVYGMDISSQMLASARTAVGKAGLHQQISMAQGDAVTFDPLRAFGELSVARIFMSYTLSMIPDWQGTLSQAMHNLEPQGELHIVDFGQSERLPRVFRHLLFRWLSLFHVGPRKCLRFVLEALAEEHDAALTFTPLYRGYAWSAVLRKR
ncbi:MAG: class I SAM-dependent methyltransferase [Parvibaculaceae bacterium]